MTLRSPWFYSLAGFILAALVGHYAALEYFPRLVFDRATDMIQENGAEVNAWVNAPRSTPEVRTVVRPSPDLSYSVCLLDLSAGPVEINVPKWDAYASLAVFQRDTENVFVGNLQGSGDLHVTVVSGKQTAPQNTEVVNLASKTGIALVRRLAPTQDAYDAAAKLTEASLCKSAK